MKMKQPPWHPTVHNGKDWVHSTLLVLVFVYGVGNLLPRTLAHSRGWRVYPPFAHTLFWTKAEGVVFASLYSFLPNYRQLSDRLLPSNLKAHIRSEPFAHSGAENLGLHNLSEKVHWNTAKPQLLLGPETCNLNTVLSPQPSQPRREKLQSQNKMNEPHSFPCAYSKIKFRTECLSVSTGKLKKKKNQRDWVVWTKIREVCCGETWLILQRKNPD